MTQPQTVHDVLDAVDNKFSDESTWTQDAYARGTDGERRSPLDPEATCWCLVGCVKSATSSDTCFFSNNVIFLLGDMARDRGYDGLPSWNDAEGRTFQEVKQFLVDAKEIAKNG